MEKNKFEQWWDDRDDAERVGLVFLASCAVCTIGGIAIGKGIAKGKFKKQLAKKDAEIASLQFDNWYDATLTSLQKPVSTTTRFIVEDPAMDELVKLLKKEGK